MNAAQVRYALQVWKDIREDWGDPEGTLFTVFPEGPYYHAMIDMPPYQALTDRFSARKEYDNEVSCIFRTFADFGARADYEHDLDGTGIKLRTVDIAWINVFDMDPLASLNEDGQPIHGNPDAASEVILQYLVDHPTYTPDFAKSFLQMRLTPRQPDTHQQVEAAYAYMEKVRDRVAERMREYAPHDMTARLASDFVEYKALQNVRTWCAGEWDVRARKPWILPASYKQHQDAELELLRQAHAYDRGVGGLEGVKLALQIKQAAEGRMVMDVLMDSLTKGDKAQEILRRADPGLRPELE
ncbi:MAG: hypothetical protein HYS17_08690 [Micavibrio aeruginosavorus]|uniref:Uncharacterized protein n=1 Tax=Micavibrio aeruginosavorus TaxID=349221 RepID=A0A7T5R145_9BACT|nr:MAG: hypothetical protein HYS17_08690 [Micavibrio aeruginosavorus]